MPKTEKPEPKHIQNRMKTVIRLHRKTRKDYGKLFYPTYMILLLIMLCLLHETIIAGLILFSFWATLIIIIAMFDNGFEIIKK
jgi:hypothetical protein